MSERPRNLMQGSARLAVAKKGETRVDYVDRVRGRESRVASSVRQAIAANSGANCLKPQILGMFVQTR